MPRVFLGLTLLVLTAIHSRAEPWPLVPLGAAWNFYLGGAPATNWSRLSFDDSSWPQGRAQLGYGEGDEATRVLDVAEEAPVTLYFRRAFVVTNRALLFNTTLRVLADDGFVVHLNGTELARRNLPEGAVGPDTFADVNVELSESNLVQIGFSSGLFNPGTNVLGVELHQHPQGRHDASFDLELWANVPFARPTVSITHPAELAVLGTSNILLEAAASDADGHVLRMDYFTNGTLLATNLRAPFAVIWTNPAPGRYALTARAYDNIFAHGDSEPVHVQIGDVTSATRVVRGPYLQSGSSTSMVVRWRTDWPGDSLVRYGTNAAAPGGSAAVGTNTINHEVLVSGLQADTLYHYSIGSAAETLASGAPFYFRTSPTNARPVRIWIIGDSGTADAHAAAVRDAYQNLSATLHTDVWMMLGDNAYGEGSDAEYQQAVFQMYPDLLRHTVLWPALGNHDAGDSPTGDSSPYQAIFTLPRRGEAGGMPSGSELYYSYDYANVHFICLDSFVSDRSVTGPMLTWLQEDLAATEKDWIIAYWHHPPYSWGGHSSDQELFGIEMRERANPILEEHGVDLVFAGHSHEYERSLLIDGHYGYSWQLQPEMIRDSSSGYGQPYRKPAGGIGSHGGTVYTVCGCSGEGGSENVAKHPAMATSLGGYGSMVLQINGLQLSARFLRSDGDIDDIFFFDKTTPSNIGPRLEIARTTGGAVVSWPTSIPAYNLFRAPALPTNQWQAVVESPLRSGRRNSVFIPASVERSFFRLQATP